MTTTVTIDEAQANLKDLIANLAPGDELVITEGDRPVADLRASGSIRTARVPGVCDGRVEFYIDDDEHLKDFREYMP